jgi:hypothetical protein
MLCWALYDSENENHRQGKFRTRKKKIPMGLRPPANATGSFVNSVRLRFWLKGIRLNSEEDCRVFAGVAGVPGFRS